VHWVLLFGFPVELLSDRGSNNFIGRVSTLLWRWTGVYKKQTTSYRPSTNGMIERAHRFLKERMALLNMDECEDDDWKNNLGAWVVWAQVVCFEHNTTKHGAFNYKFAPADLMFVTPGHTPTDAALQFWVDSAAKAADDERKDVRAGLDMVANILSMAAKARVQGALEQQEKYDALREVQMTRQRDAKDLVFKIGDSVLIKENYPTKSKASFGPRHSAGWRIKVNPSPNVFVVSRARKGEAPEERVVNASSVLPAFKTTME
jgi:hypothetical protein